MVGVTSQGSGAGEWSDKPGIRAGSAENQTGTGTGNRAQENTQHQGRVCRSECPLNTPV
ncbi:unnamed protein product [Staurois parvus]|uniref:Uncharacterized protein n=1 Tax=Staurois parvus TaxID=386267 RepID=A0ABN9DYN9_9NEOB|nr:unnamed protein product [Staurois parvus]